MSCTSLTVDAGNWMEMYFTKEDEFVPGLPILNEICQSSTIPFWFVVKTGVIEKA
jgi:hypothetical protein